MRWQIKRMMPINIPLFLHYTRYGHYIGIRKIAIDALILLDGLKSEAITLYLANLILYDPDAIIQYSTARSIFNFVLLCFNSLNAGYYPEMQKNCLMDRLKLLADDFQGQVTT